MREILGQRRIECQDCIRFMNALYKGALRLYINFFQPVQRCIKKIREGSKIKKWYDEAKTPYQRIKENPHINKQTKIKLTKIYKSLDPVILLEKINTILNKIEKIEKNKKAKLTSPYSIVIS